MIKMHEHLAILMKNLKFLVALVKILLFIYNYHYIIISLPEVFVL